MLGGRQNENAALATWFGGDLRASVFRVRSDSAIAFHCSGLFLSGSRVPIRPALKGWTGIHREDVCGIQGRLRKLVGHRREPERWRSPSRLSKLRKRAKPDPERLCALAFQELSSKPPQEPRAHPTVLGGALDSGGAIMPTRVLGRACGTSARFSSRLYRNGMRLPDKLPSGSGITG